MGDILSAISSATSAVSALSNLLLVSPQNTVGYQPQAFGETTPVGNPILFHYEGEQSSVLEFDITDHFIEDNTAIQDQIAIKPVIITTHGFIGELNDVAPSILKPLQEIANKLVTIGAYTPGLSATALIAYNEAAFAYAIAENAFNAAISSLTSLGNFITGGSSGGENVITGQSITNLGGQNKQQLAYQQFYGNAMARNLFTIQTPWAVFQNMAIKSLRAVQDAETTMITDFEITFKQMNFASTSVSTGNIDALGRLLFQSALPTNLGTAALSPSSVAFPYAPGN